MFPERLKALRFEANLTQNDVSRQFGVSQPTYSNWEKGEKKPTPDKYPKIAEFYNVSTDYLLGKSDYKNSDGILANLVLLLICAISLYLSDEEKKILEEDLREFLLEREKAIRAMNKEKKD